VEDSMKKRNLIKMAPVTLAAITALTAVFSFGSADSIKVVYGEETSETEKEDEIKYGDINGDGHVNASDGVLIKKHLAGLSVKIDKIAGDVNLDGSVDIADAVLIMKHLAGMGVDLGSAQQPTKPEPTTPEQTTPEQTTPEETPSNPDDDEYFVYPHNPAYMQPTDEEKMVNGVIRELGLKKSMSRAEIITTYLTAQFNAYKDYYTTPDDSADKEEKDKKSTRYSSCRRDVLKTACGIPYREDACEDYGMMCSFDFVITTMEDGSVLYSDIHAAIGAGIKKGDWNNDNVILLVPKEEMYRITAEKYGCVWR